MALDGLGNDALRSVIDIKNNVKETQGEVRSLNSEFKKLGLETININSAFSALNSSANKFAEIQESSTKTSKSTADAVKEQNKQQNIAREISIQIENINKRLLKAQGEEEKVLVRQSNALSNAKVNAEGLATSFGQLAQDAASIDRKTEFFTGLSEVAKDIPGLRKLSGPFQEAAKAARETVLSNAKAVDIQDRLGSLSKDALKNGKGLSKEKLNQMKLTDITNGKTGPEAAKLLRNAKSTAKTQSVGLAGLKGGFKALGPLIRTAFGPIGIIFAVVSIVKAIVSAMFAASELSAKFQRNLMVSSDAAGEIRDRTYDIAAFGKEYADTQGKTLILQKAILEQFDKANKALGIAMDLTSELGKEFGGQLLAGSAFLAENFGLTEAAIGEIQKESVVTGKNVSTIAQEMSGVIAATTTQKGIMVDVNEVIEETSKISGELRLNFKNSNKEIARGITSLKLMGMNLTQLKGSSSSLLDFESSIAAEMEAELLTGRELNLEGARRAALDGDLVKLGKELSKQGVDYNELEEMNVLQRQAYAKAVGLSVDELSDSLKTAQEFEAVERRAAKFGLQAMNVQSASLVDIRKQAEAAGASQEDLVKILGEEIYKRKEAEGAQERFNKVLEKMKETLSSFVSSGALDKLADAATVFADTLAQGGSVFSFFGDSDLDKNLKAAKVKKEKERTAELKAKGNKRSEDEEKEYQSIIDNNTRKEQKIAMHQASLMRGPKFATGGIVTKRINNATIGEAGPEAIIPLSKASQYGLGNEEVVMLLKEILVATKSGGDVYIERNKIGKVLDMDNPKMGISI